MFQQLSRAVVESFSANPETPANPAVTREVFAAFLSALVAFMVALLLVALIGKYLWNEAVVQLIAVARPARSLWQVLGLFLFLALFKC
jgi:hypothetical protein